MNVKVTVLSELCDDVWSTDVWVNEEMVGCGTSPRGPLDIAGDVLYGTKNDWLNGDEGALKRALEANTESDR